MGHGINLVLAAMLAAPKVYKTRMVVPESGHTGVHEAGNGAGQWEVVTLPTHSPL